MRDHAIDKSMTKLPASFLLAATLALLVSCGDNLPATPVDPLAPPPPTPPSVIALGTDTNFILTDNATAATLTATLVDASNALMAGVPVSFSASTGNLSAATATTDVNGQATVTLKSGLSDMTNRTANVTTSVAGQSASIPILIKGSTLVLTLPSNSIQVGAGTITATATAADAGGLGKSNQTIRFSVGAASTGAGTLSAATLTTDATGVATPLTFTPTAAGTVVLTAEWLNSAGAVTVAATKDIIVDPANGTPFAFTLPTANPAPLTTLASAQLAVSVPPTIGTTGTVANVRISVTGGTVTGTTQPTAALTSITQIPAAINCPNAPATTNCVTATYTAPSYSGLVTVQVDALDAAGVSLSSLSRTFAISAPSAAAAKLFLSPSVSTIVPSSGTNISTSTLEVTVRDSNNNTVSGAAVLFGLLGTTGSGEYVSPAVAYTDSNGKATSTFSAGSAPTLATIYVQARVVGQVCSFNPSTPLVPEANAMCDAAPMMVSSSAVSVVIGFSTKIVSAYSDTQYQLPGSVHVVNSNGSAVAGVKVTLTAFPVEYRNGSIFPIKDLASDGTTFVWQCGGPYDTRTLVPIPPIVAPPAVQEYEYQKTPFTAAEDVNRNGIKEAGEDTIGNGALDAAEDLDGDSIIDPGEDANFNNILDVSEDANGNTILDPGEDTIPIALPKNRALAIANNGMLSPPQAAGGGVPLTVTTDSNGAATFMLQYLKASAWFIKDEVTARVIVMGTESSAKTTFTLPMSVTDQFDPVCAIGRTASY